MAKPPLGVMPWWLWSKAVPEPDIADLLHRYTEVDKAVTRYRQAGLRPDPQWLAEVLGTFPRDPQS